jgi:hypothetical protein
MNLNCIHNMASKNTIPAYKWLLKRFSKSNLGQVTQFLLDDIWREVILEL